MSKLNTVLVGMIVILGIILSAVYVQNSSKEITETTNKTIEKINNIAQTDTPTSTLPPIPNYKLLTTNYHIYQSFNNCGPASLSMALSYYGYNVSQQELGNALRPYQVAGGDNDDKSVTLEELAKEAEKYNLIAYHRPNGNVEILKHFIAQDIPIVTRTWLEPNEDIGHYRVVKGYDDRTGELIQDDSLQGQNLRYSYEELNEIWKKFNYEYLVLVPADKQQIAEQILGEDADPQTAWQNAVRHAEGELAQNPDDTTARFNLSVALYNAGDYKGAIEEFEKVENQLSFRTLWYQIEPIEAYYEVGNYDRVFEITDRILNNHNRAFSELYIIRGNIYRNQGDLDSARQEYEKAVLYNVNLEEAQTALESI